MAQSHKPRSRPLKEKGLSGSEPLSGAMAKVRITQVRSQIGQSQKHRGTLRALGLGRIGKTAEHDDGPVFAGMLRKVRHLVKVDNG